MVVKNVSRFFNDTCSQLFSFTKMCCCVGGRAVAGRGGRRCWPFGGLERLLNEKTKRFLECIPSGWCRRAPASRLKQVLTYYLARQTTCTSSTRWTLPRPFSLFSPLSLSRCQTLTVLSLSLFDIQGCARTRAMHYVGMWCWCVKVVRVLEKGKLVLYRRWICAKIFVRAASDSFQSSFGLSQCEHRGLLESIRLKIFFATWILSVSCLLGQHFSLLLHKSTIIWYFFTKYCRSF